MDSSKLLDTFSCLCDGSWISISVFFWLALFSPSMFVVSMTSGRLRLIAELLVPPRALLALPVLPNSDPGLDIASEFCESGLNRGCWALAVTKSDVKIGGSLYNLLITVSFGAADGVLMTLGGAYCCCCCCCIVIAVDVEAAAIDFDLGVRSYGSN